jgi:hypothetical protein
MGTEIHIRGEVDYGFYCSDFHETRKLSINFREHFISNVFTFCRNNFIVYLLFFVCVLVLLRVSLIYVGEKRPLDYTVHMNDFQKEF